MSTGRRRLSPEERRVLLLEAAVRTFGRLGYDACRMEDIAKEAGVAKGLLYRHFASKDELFTALMQDRGDDFARRLTERLAAVTERSTDPWQLVGAGVSLWVELITGDVGGYRWLVRTSFDDPCAPFRERVRNTIATQAQALSPTLDDEMAGFIAAALNGVIEGVTLEWASRAGESERSADEVLRFLVAFCIRGLDGVRGELGLGEVPPLDGPPAGTASG